METSINQLLNWYKERIENNELIPPALWIDSAMKMNVLISEIDLEIVDLRGTIADIMVLCLDEGKSSSEAKIRANSGDVYKRYLRASAKKEQVSEFIRLSKLRARLADEEMKGY